MPFTLHTGYVAQDWASTSWESHNFTHFMFKHSKGDRCKITYCVPPQANHLLQELIKSFDGLLPSVITPKYRFEPKSVFRRSSNEILTYFCLSCFFAVPSFLKPYFSRWLFYPAVNTKERDSFFRACLHGVGDPGLVGLVSFVFTLWGTQNKRNLPH